MNRTAEDICSVERWRLRGCSCKEISCLMSNR
uniref:Uncharacterized protein n=1 Tax=Arundo donax TaxID=35708 RepID=A0A0A9GWU7_ARUDO